MDDLITLKAMAYDHLAKIEALQIAADNHRTSLREINAKIIDLTTKDQLEPLPSTPTE